MLSESEYNLAIKALNQLDCQLDYVTQTINLLENRKNEFIEKDRQEILAKGEKNKANIGKYFIGSDGIYYLKEIESYGSGASCYYNADCIEIEPAYDNEPAIISMGETSISDYILNYMTEVTKNEWDKIVNCPLKDLEELWENIEI